MTDRALVESSRAGVMVISSSGSWHGPAAFASCRQGRKNLDLRTPLSRTCGMWKLNTGCPQMQASGNGAPILRVSSGARFVPQQRKTLRRRSRSKRRAMPASVSRKTRRGMRSSWHRRWPPHCGDDKPILACRAARSPSRTRYYHSMNQIRERDVIENRTEIEADYKNTLRLSTYEYLALCIVGLYLIHFTDTSRCTFLRLDRIGWPLHRPATYATGYATRDRTTTAENTQFAQLRQCRA